MGPLPLKAGDHIRITHEGRTLAGEVILASSNSVSLMVTFEGIMAGFVGMAPLLWHDGEGYRALNGAPFEITRSKG